MTSEPTEVTFCVRGVISPLLSNIYLHVVDRVWEYRCAHVGTLVRYADDFVVMCNTKAQVEQARRRVTHVLTRLGLHPEKTRLVDLSCGREGFDFIGCHLRKRMSGPIWERTRRRVCYLQRWPTQRAMARVRARVRDLTPRARCQTDLRLVIADLNRCSAAGHSTSARAMRRPTSRPSTNTSNADSAVCCGSALCRV